MTKIISSSNNANSVLVIGSGGKLAYIDVKVGKNKIRYHSEHIVSIADMDSDTFRNAGTAAAGAIIGGVLTGGVGLLAGAAYGGRRKKMASYVIKFTDGNYIAITEDAKSAVAALDGILLKQKVAEHIKSESPPNQPMLSRQAPLALEDDATITADYQPVDAQERVLAAPAREYVSAPKVTKEGPNFFVGAGVLGIILGLFYLTGNFEGPLLVGFFIVGLICWAVIWLIMILVHKARS